MSPYVFAKKTSALYNTTCSRQHHSYFPLYFPRTYPTTYPLWTVLSVLLCWCTNVQQRELQLMAKRMGAFRHILASSIEQFSRQNHHYFVEQRGKTTIRIELMQRANMEKSREWFEEAKLRRILSECGQHIEITLRNWRGVRNSQKIRECTVTFRTYFNIAKNWFDQVKSNTMTLHFWTPILCAIDTVLLHFIPHDFACIFHRFSMKFVFSLFV